MNSTPLLADEVLIIGPDGQIGGKADDLATHRGGIVRIQAMAPPETNIRLMPGAAIVLALMEMEGTYLAQPFSGRYRYTRVWSRQNGSWQIIAAHISLVPGHEAH